ASIMLLTYFIPKKIVSVNALESDYSCSAKSMCVIEQTSKRVLLEKEKDLKLPMASTTKVMTALIALEHCDNLDEQFFTDNKAVGIEGTSIYLRKDEKLSMRELLYGLMLNSGNDAAMAIAYKIGNGDLQKFVDMMNDKAKELNLQNTHFDNPHGLDSKTHYTSAYDLAVITAVAMENEDFREIVKTPVKQISAPKEMGSRFVRNKHKLLKTMEGCEGVKTGFTDNARRCCVTSCNRNGMRLICVVLNCNDMFLESQKCIEKCYDNYEFCTIVKPYQYISNTNVDDGLKDKVQLYVKNGFKFPLKDDEKDKLVIETKYDEILDAPVEKNKEVGEIKVFFENELIYSEKICTIEEVKEKTITDKMKDIFDNWYMGGEI
ncbi:MAG: D-alanyl-D-alanine carboxypeptidase, partial [Clostridiales bacterium]|nr:D-alanyl-D-alanine carboxypeptidase [Candidatus Apopatousia equi]